MKGCLKFSSLSPTPTPALDGHPSSSTSSTHAEDALGASSSGGGGSPGVASPFYANSNASTSSTCSATSSRKCVAFGAEGALEEVYTADEWDRTPTEPARKLTYQ
ncbi:hypothetical protein CVT25_010008 [Psilocybe cyanescens]|uniref:Uncharacterized protein n=1 Tax=Psilocybe cyanescens TaxID=93625 RepID=A0A409X3B1_PSICY|nr:hypothetical protein CVT25_010008 [Psilocybe cyanescens]